MEINSETQSLVVTMGITSSTLNLVRTKEHIPYLNELYDEKENKYIFTSIYTGKSLKDLIIVPPTIRLDIATTAEVLTDEVVQEMVKQTLEGLQEGFKMKAEFTAKYGIPPPVPEIPINWRAVQEQQITYFMNSLSKYRIIENFITEKMLHPFLQPQTEVLNWEFISNESIASEDEEQNDQFDKYK